MISNVQSDFDHRTLFTISRERKKACSSASESSSKRAPGRKIGEKSTQYWVKNIKS